MKINAFDLATDIPQGFSMCQMNEEEVQTLGSWATQEGWNPGRNDLKIAWNYNPKAFIGLKYKHELIGAGSVMTYGKTSGFMGLFILRRDFRNRGLGHILWKERLRKLRERLDENSSICMDGVFNMAPYYEKGGFRLLYRDLRFQGIANSRMPSECVPLNTIDFSKIARFDQIFFKADRSDFLQAWLSQEGGQGLAILIGNKIAAYGFIRPAHVGFKVGPVFSVDADNGTKILRGLLSLVPNEQVQIDIPEVNTAAMSFMQKIDFEQVFGCARMVHGSDPKIPAEGVFGITSFEFG
jgi:GNAT superfamily N-acetyltransferase